MTVFDGKLILRCGAAPFVFVFVFVILSSFGCAIGLVSGRATKAAVAFSKLFAILQQGQIRPSYFQANVLSKISFTNCYSFGFIKYFNLQRISIRKILLLHSIGETGEKFSRGTAKKNTERGRQSAILTDTLVKIALEEEANSAKTRKATEACKKLISNKEPLSTASSKVESGKKELKKGKDTRIQAKKFDEDEEFKTCVYAVNTSMTISLVMIGFST